MQPFPDLTGLDVFPWMENDTLELKEALNSCSNEKMYQTICGFLNNKGGYLVFGVTDSLVIKGLPSAKLKDLDNAVQKFDSIHHLKLIVCENGDSIAPEAIRANVLEVGENKLIVVTATPSPNTKYKLKDGSRWYRLSASNYRIQDESHEKVMMRLTNDAKMAKREADLAGKELVVARQEKNIYADKLHACQKRLEATVEELTKLRADTAALLRGTAKAEESLTSTQNVLKMSILLRKNAEASLASTLKLLEMDILARKEGAEKEIEAEKERQRSWWNCILCGLL